MRLLFCLSVILFLSAATPGQTRDTTDATARTDSLTDEQARGEVDRLLNSVSIKDRAWAAYYIGKFRLKDYVPALVDLARSAVETVQPEDLLLSRAALDSLIQLHVQVPADDVMALYKRFPDEVMILLARYPKENQATLLAIVREANPQAENSPYWLAACNLLTEIEAKGFAAYLLSELTITLTIFVTDTPGQGFGEGLGFSIGCGASAGVWPEGYPPIAYYSLTEKANRGGVVVAPGVPTIYYERSLSIEQEHPAIWQARSHYSWRKSEYLPGYLAALLKTTKDNFPVSSRRTFTHEWQTREEYKLMLQIHQADAQRGYYEVMQQLVERGLLSGAESESLPPKIVTKVIDARRSKSVRLPDLPGVDKSQ